MWDLNMACQHKNVAAWTFLLGAFFLAPGFLRGQDAVPQRPEITGISHVGYFVSDLSKTLSFWHDLLGFDEYTTLSRPGTDQIRIAFIKINDHQHIELFTDKPPAPPNMMSHYCFSVSNVDRCAPICARRVSM